VTRIDDTIDTTTVTLTASAGTIAEGGSLTYTVAVNNPVTGSPFVVTLSPSPASTTRSTPPR
ncbi:immunoglobulin-like domain-containing protein, partial [Rhizobacter sp. Root1221]|uniref:immunoglobulin-like domain-containing protein n=1 Tax=Rhizobacter sp. Root1221 TaxID=1736433 RepID=UPI000A932B8F